MKQRRSVIRQILFIGGGGVENITINVEVETEKMDLAIEKANQLVKLLKEAKNIIDSL